MDASLVYSAFWKELTGRLKDSEAFLTGRTLTKPASTLDPDGLTAPAPPRGSLGGRASARACLANHLDTIRTPLPRSTWLPSRQLCSPPCKASGQARPRNPAQP